MAKETKAVDTEPEITVKPVKAEDLVTIRIDREMTDGGITVNGKKYVGDVKVTKEQADDLMRIAEEYYETKKKLVDGNVNVRMKSDAQKEKLFLADPKQYAMNRNFTRDYGMLSAQEWAYCSDSFKEYLLSMRKAMYGY